ncbi:hypothetical protein MJO28_015587 [Puccinia striiformis f. sp. tritici]|uniref:Uncharacterized protein n=1 Tax=Puccinia striiformis f. sp. tritici TaxID=168172 RepID=A0ACC0DP89_9BASI|nr:hypothetical protein MJO28_015587 [Puccinia striiformis f. sp. tritici]
MNFLYVTSILTITAVMLNQAVEVFGAVSLLPINSRPDEPCRHWNTPTPKRPIKLGRRTLNIGGPVGIEPHSIAIARRANGIRPDTGTEAGVSGGTNMNGHCCH